MPAFYFGGGVGTGTWYVRKDGDDANPGSWDEPFITLAHALSVAAVGDHIRIVGPGTWTETLLQVTKRLTMHFVDAMNREFDETEYDDTQRPVVDGSADAAVFEMGANTIWWVGGTIIGSQYGIRSTGVDRTGVTIQGTRFEDCLTAAVTDLGNTAKLYQLQKVNCGPIESGAAGNTSIRIHGFLSVGGNGPAFYAPGANCKMAQATIVDCVAPGGTAADVYEIINSIAYSTGGVADTGLTFGAGGIKNCHSYGHAIADFSAAPDADSFAEDPLFLDPVHADYHLRHDSPCICTGDADLDIEYDLDILPWNEPPSRGCYSAGGANAWIREVTDEQFGEGVEIVGSRIDRALADLVADFNSLRRGRIQSSWVETTYSAGWTPIGGKTTPIVTPYEDLDNWFPWLLANNNYAPMSGTGGRINELRFKGARVGRLDPLMLDKAFGQQLAKDDALYFDRPAILDGLSLQMLRHTAVGATDYLNTFQWGAANVFDGWDPLSWVKDVVIQVSVDSPFDTERASRKELVANVYEFNVGAHWFSPLGNPTVTADLSVVDTYGGVSQGVDVVLEDLNIPIPAGSRVHIATILPRYDDDDTLVVTDSPWGSPGNDAERFAQNQIYSWTAHFLEQLVSRRYDG